MLTRRATIVALGAASVGTVLGVRPGRTQTFPNRPVTIVVPYPPGGSVDVMVRILAAAMGPDLGTTFVIENKGGGAGAIGTLAAARAAPDGYTLLLGTQQTHAANVSLLKRLPYDPVKDFTVIAGLAVIPHLLVARKDLGPASVAELIALARTKPDTLNYGSTGLGSASQLAMELFRKQAGIAPMVHVPFRGAAPLVQELLGGRIDIAMISIPSVVSAVKADRLKALAVARETRIPLVPDLPTTAEAGVPGVNADAWFALFAPAGTPQAIVDRLYQALAKAMAREDVEAKFVEQGIGVVLRPGPEAAQELPGEIRRWAEVVQAAGISPE
jgi:tripartite-type tricarboxylate transporter receptor subunit TctC